MVPDCELCDDQPAYCLIGIWENEEREPDAVVTLEKKQVKYACAMCSERLVKKGIAREYPITAEKADAYEVWGSENFALTSDEGGTVKTDSWKTARKQS